MNNQQLRDAARAAVLELLDAARLKPGDIFVVGCSSSEIVGQKIGTCSSEEAASAVLEGIYPVLKERGIYLAAQCCEHLNRALILEREAVERYRLTEVNAVPQADRSPQLPTTRLSIRRRWKRRRRRRVSTSAARSSACTLFR